MSKEQKHRYAKGMHSFLRVFLFIYTRLFSIKASISKEVKDLKPPYLLLSNHIGTWDPFVIGYFLNDPIHFVSSDAVFRDRFMRMILTRMGVIPKKKNVKDTRVIRTMINVIKNDNCIGLFPEASRSWIGRTMYIDASTAKLIKLLKVPVVTAKMKGMQLFNPRWGTWLRKTKVNIDYELTLTKDQVQIFDETMISDLIRSKLYHNEVEYQQKKMNALQSTHKAEYISYVLFMCPVCDSIGKIRNKGNDFRCDACESQWHINNVGFFVSKKESLIFDNIIDWYDWQLVAFANHIQEKVNTGSTDFLFHDDKMILFKEKNNGFKRIGLCSIYFYIDRIEFLMRSGKQIIMPIQNIETLSPQLRERIEIGYSDNAFRLKGKIRGVSGLKWEIACNVVWKNLNQHYKMSNYFKSESGEDLI